MALNRRTFLRTGSAALIGTLAAPRPLRAATGPRVFDLYRGDKRIGQQTLDVGRSGSQINVAVDINIEVRILGLSAYSYQLYSREVWADGALQRLEGKANDNGTPHRVSVLRTGGGLQIDGSGFRGTVQGNPATTTYWSQAFLSRPTWISTQDGKPMNINTARAGSVEVPTPAGPTRATVWNVRGDIGRLDLFYDANGEWVGNRFEARGEQARFVLARTGKPLAPIWS
ncbi:DUF6134 family protein [Oceanibium sediminis]|uniref:DUF6134 family protein n=1 Tax=Oceanibium sediminis TaxID=2026339 RepID=UPI000DD2DB76|nr:DUF6134 family protein [Oceanibium sediminis]